MTWRTPSIEGETTADFVEGDFDLRLANRQLAISRKPNRNLIEIMNFLDRCLEQKGGSIYDNEVTPTKYARLLCIVFALEPVIA
ncbi:hypothetical protein FM996_20930 [Methylosinus sporium]|uniref:RNA-directed RNA polymerase apple chlorotic leaf spot virus domain-containing protein n=1 Tax=Methylosinus sporium TaxID=428 RepID=A0A549SCV5_METSR|nr:hypothetical protein FM996_20930 [Methylosinus sporium]